MGDELVGSTVQTNRPNSATKTLKTMMAAPTRPIGLRHFPRKARRRLGIASQTATESATASVASEGSGDAISWAHSCAILGSRTP